MARGKTTRADQVAGGIVEAKPLDRGRGTPGWVMGSSPRRDGGSVGALHGAVSRRWESCVRMLGRDFSRTGRGARAGEDTARGGAAAGRGGMEGGGRLRGGREGGGRLPGGLGGGGSCPLPPQSRARFGSRGGGGSSILPEVSSERGRGRRTSSVTVSSPEGRRPEGARKGGDLILASPASKAQLRSDRKVGASRGPAS